jgi:hypothetical protein
MQNLFCVLYMFTTSMGQTTDHRTRQQCYSMFHSTHNHTVLQQAEKTHFTVNLSRHI